MYGGGGVSAFVRTNIGNVGSDISDAVMNVMYNGNLYTGEPDGAYAGGILYKFNVKTGETKVLMSRAGTKQIPTFRGAVQRDGKLYFIGMLLDLENNPGLTQAEIQYSILYQSAFPCVYEIDPANDDAMTCIYDCGVGSADDWRQLVNDKVFTSTRAISFYEDALVVGGLNTSGVFLAASENPSEGQDSFGIILNMDDFRSLGVMPAYHRSDVNGGGGIYQTIEYNGKLYVVICTGDAASQNEETGTKSTFAIARGTLREGGDPAVHDDWTWSLLAGPDGTGAKYPLGLDTERVSCGACTLQVYGDYLYIGEYNDTSSGLQNMITRKDFRALYTNMQQSINLYRMDADETIEKVVGDPTEAFPESLTGVGSGYGTHMTQYTWQTTVHDGKMFLSTMDETTLLEPIAQFTNGDLLGMSGDEWERQINYIQVLLDLLFPESGDDSEGTAANVNAPVLASDGSASESANVSETISAPDTKEEAAEMITEAIETENNQISETSVEAALDALDIDETADALTTDTPETTLTDDQIDSMAEKLVNGTYEMGSLDSDIASTLSDMATIMAALSELVDTNDIETFESYYGELVDILKSIEDAIPDDVKTLFETLLKYTTRENMTYLAKCLPYLATSEAGFDLYTFTNNDDGTVTMETITTNGFGDRYSHGLRVFAETTDYFVIGTASPFYGSQLWRCKNTAKNPDPVNPDDPNTPNDPVNPDDGDGGNGKVDGNIDNSANANTDTPAATPVNAKKAVSNANQTKKVKTNDSASIALYICLMASAGSAIAVIFSRKRKTSDGQ